MSLIVILAVIVFASLILVFVGNKPISIFFSSYWRTLVIAVPILIYSIIVMWAPGINDFIHTEPNTEWSRSNLYSGAFLLQLPCLMCILLPILLIIDKTKNVSKVLAPFLIVYTLINFCTRFFGFSSLLLNDNTPWYEYVFLGEPDDKMFFLSNFFTLLLSCFVLISSKTFTKYSFFGGLFLYGLILLYYLLMKYLLNINSSISGLGFNDWIQNNNNGVINFAMFLPLSNVFGSINDLGFVSTFNIWLFILIFFSWIIIFLKNFLTINPIKISKVQEPWYKKSTFLNGFLSPFDAALNNLLNIVIPYGYFYPETLKKLKLKNFKRYYNNFISLSTIDKYEKYMDSLEYQLNNRNEKVSTLLSVQKNRVDKYNEMKSTPSISSRLDELEKEIENELKNFDYKKDMRKNKKMQKQLEREARKNNILIMKQEPKEIDVGVEQNLTNDNVNTENNSNQKETEV